MEAAASSLSSLLATLRVDDPWTPPATWDSISREGSFAGVADSTGSPPRDPIYELTSVPDSALVRLALHALHGIKSSLDEIKELSVLFSSSPADRTSHRVANVWSRSASTASVGHILNSICSTGLAVFFLCKFVHFYLFQSRELKYGSREGQGREHDVSDDKDTEHPPPYSLVNQGFAAAVEKVLEGYFCSLNTLPPSIKLRRSVGKTDRPSVIPDQASCNSSSEVTLLEVYLHTEELRRHIKSLGNICFPKFAGLALCQEGLTTDVNLEFENFPRGTDLLSYLYVRLRDADPVHYALLKYLFIRSCEPYCNFIKFWIYRASVDDPYEEFLITQTENKQNKGGSLGGQDDFTALSFKGMNHVSVPCFLQDICNPLLRTGQQLQVLMKLVKSCNFCTTGEDTYASSKTIRLEEILPWFDTPIESSGNSFTFSKSRAEAAIWQRDTMYKSMLEKLHHFFSNIEIVPFGPVSNSIYTSKSPLDTAVSDVEQLYGDTHALPTYEMDADEKDHDTSSTSQESSDKLDPLESSECSSYSSLDEIEIESGIACGDFSSSMLSSCPASMGEAKCSSETKNVFSYQTGSLQWGTNPASPNAEHYRDGYLSSSNVHVHPQNMKHNVMPDALELDYQYSKFWPFGKFPKNTFNSSPGKMCLVDDFLYTDDGGTVEVSRGDTVYPSHDEKFCKISRTWNGTAPYNLSTNPILKNAACHHMESDLQGKRKNRALPSFVFESVTNPCEVYCGRSTYCLVDSEAGEVVQSAPQISEQSDCCSKLLEAKTGSQEYLASSEEMAAVDNLKENVCGGALWEQLLEYTSKSTEKIAGESSAASDMPLDIAIEKSIIQEILLQYKYVSSFTMKLLEEGFDLCGHLLALRRYHFMEQADWADSFIVSIYRKKLLFVKSEQKRAEIQGLLDLALQRSSCDTDPFKGRLFIYMNEQPEISLAASGCGLDMLDDILLGYKVDWPVNIVITEEALGRYAEIFCYLLQVRFAVFSLTEVWRFLKELTQLISRSSHSRPDIMKELNSVMKVRHQVYHFLSTLQQYHHFNLSDISWRRFQHSLKNQVKDMLDIEYVHLCYVKDALHICFLSNETKPVATIIKSMLQQALEFRSCFKSLADFSESTVDHLDLHSVINFTKVDSIGSKFETNIKDLYILHSKSSKYEEIGLSRFWGNLNYNEYHSSKINKDLGLGCFYYL